MNTLYWAGWESRRGCGSWLMKGCASTCADEEAGNEAGGGLHGGWMSGKRGERGEGGYGGGGGDASSAGAVLWVAVEQAGDEVDEEGKRGRDAAQFGGFCLRGRVTVMLLRCEQCAPRPSTPPA